MTSAKEIKARQKAMSITLDLCRSPEISVTVETAVYRQLLLYTNAEVLACGTLYNVVGKNLGAGVYKVSLAPAN